MEASSAVLPLTERPITQLSPDQLALFTRESMHATEAGAFDLEKTAQELSEKEGQQLIAVDMGGDKIVATLFEIHGEKLQKCPELDITLKSHHGEGYLAVLEETAAYATEHTLPVGVSYAGIMEGSKPVGGPNVTAFRRELSEKYDGDFANLFPTLAGAKNDAVAGLIAGSIEAHKQNPNTHDVLYVINGSGIGGAVLKDGVIFTAEGGHIEAISSLNIFNQQKKCGVFSTGYTCIEVIGGNKAGIEDQWYQHTQEKLSGKAIEDRYKAGDQFAGNLYDNSALVLAHMIQGVAAAFSIDLSASSSAVVGHGGAFRFPQYGERIQQIIEAHTGHEPMLLLAKDFTENSCLDGAALIALSKTQ